MSLGLLLLRRILNKQAQKKRQPAKLGRPPPGSLFVLTPWRVTFCGLSLQLLYRRSHIWRSPLGLLVLLPSAGDQRENQARG